MDEVILVIHNDRHGNGGDAEEELPEALGARYADSAALSARHIRYHICQD